MPHQAMTTLTSTKDKKSKGSAKAKNRSARMAAVQTVYRAELSDMDYITAADEYIKNWAGKELEGNKYVMPDVELLKLLISKTSERRSDTEKLLIEAAGNSINMDRLEALLKSIFTVSIAELLTQRDTSTGVIINDYIEICKAFFADREPALVNAVLDKVAKTLGRQ